MSRWELTATITLLAIAQLYVQFTFFLHIGLRAESKVRSWFLLFTLTTVAILVFGSIWIMNNLNYNMMRSPETPNNIVQDELIAK
jgi:cytochrome o ubiquinol oxidase operon protein cyoD